MLKKVKVGVVGCGMISKAYFESAKEFKILDIVACADINMSAAEKKADEYNLKALSVDEIMADKEIEIILNLTIPGVHAEVAVKALESGKHVYGEKPLAVSREDGRKILDTAKAAGLLVGSAPDTFLGGGIQTCRKLIDENWIGEAVAGTAFMMSHGPESWHDNPGFYYQQGGGPMFDMGPYFLTALIYLLGPVKRVGALCSATFKERIATSETNLGKIYPVEVPTHYSGILEFHNGAVINMVMSFDVWGHGNSRSIELYGTEGSLKVPNPNTFGGPVSIMTANMSEWMDCPLSHAYTDKKRGIGLADMAYAIRSGRKHRCNGDLAFHVLDIMCTFEEASKAGKLLDVQSCCAKPSAFPSGLRHGLLDE